MDKEILSFNKIKPDSDFMDEVFSYDVRKLESTDGVKISQYAIALSQYLIYFKSQVNRSKAEINRKKRVLESGINQALTEDILKRYKTKTNALAYLITNNKELNGLNEEIDVLKDEVFLVEGVDKVVGDLISSLKRELTRRENEMYSIRKEKS